MKKQTKPSETYHLKEIDKGVDKLNLWFVVNTIATIITGVAAVTLAFFALLK